MTINKQRLRWMVYTQLAVLGLLVLWAVVMAAQGHWLWLAVGLALGLPALYAHTWVAVICLVLIVLTGQWWLAAIALAGVLTRLLPRTVPLASVLGERDDAALAAAVQALPGQLRECLAGSDIVVSTPHLVQLAAAERPRAWDGAFIGPPGDLDGVVLVIGAERWTSCAAETAALARELCQERDRNLDLQAMATAAVLVPESAAARWLNPGHRPAFELAGDVFELDQVRLIAVLKRFTMSAEGADAMRRMEARVRADGQD